MKVILNLLQAAWDGDFILNHNKCKACLTMLRM
jgi:hypothetical protein